MAQRDDARWVEVSPSQFDHERSGLAAVRNWLPNESPYRAWSNFEFRDGQGHWHECDLLVLGPAGLYLIELRHYYGVLDGDDRRWRRNGGRYEDSPLLLCRRKAQRLASKLKDAAKEWALEKGADVDAVQRLVPYLQEAVYLHHDQFVCRLPESSALGLFGNEDAEATSNLPPLSQLVTREPRRQIPIGPNAEAILAELMARIGLVQRREREAGSWVIQEGVVDEGDGWQDWLCDHKVDKERHGRVRFSVDAPGLSQADRDRQIRLARNEYALARTLKHDGILTPDDLVQSDLGTGLVYPYDESWQRLDLWLRDHTPVPLDVAMAVIHQIGDALRYAHDRGVAHRALGAGAVRLRDNHGVEVQLRDWRLSGALAPTESRHAVTALAKAARLTLSATEEAWMLEAFLAPESLWDAGDRARLDVFSVGALAAYVLSGKPPAASGAALRERLRAQKGIDVAIDSPVPDGIRAAILDATRGVVSERTATVAGFLDALDAALTAAAPPEDAPADPLDARPGVTLDGRFQVDKRLGLGSTARGLLVTDLADAAHPRRVLKIAVDDDAARRIEVEAQVLTGLVHKRFAALVEGPIDVGGRRALLLEPAGTTTLADELRPGRPVPLDYLERWGTDLMDALVELDRLGIDHRDIKPANLGVRENPGDRKQHLVLFDFSLARATADQVEAGTPQYRDPFLGEGRRQRFDSHAERYSAAVVLHEMTTGRLPQFGDGQTMPVLVDEEATIDPAAFPPSLAREFVDFFTTALRRDARQRFDTAQAMAAAWAAIFASGRTTVLPTETDDALAAEATLDTPIDQAGITARGLSALAPFGVHTVRDFLAKVDAGHKYPQVAMRTRDHLKERRRTWAARLGDPRASRDRAPQGGVDVAAQVLLDAAGPASANVRRALYRQIIGHAGDLHAFDPPVPHGAAMKPPQPARRVQALLQDLLDAWAGNDDATLLLGQIITTLDTRIRDSGGVVSLGEATSAVLDAVTEPNDTPGLRRTARGLLRLALERLRLLRAEGATDAEAISVRRRDGAVVLLGSRPELFDAVEAVGRAAEELITSSTGEDHSRLVGAKVASARLAEAIAPFGTEEIPLPAALRVPDRLLRLGTELAPHGASASNGDLHHLDLPAYVALAETLRGHAGRGVLKPDEVRARVAERFPAIPRLPDHPRLDEVVARAEIGMRWVEEARGYRLVEHTPATTGIAMSATASPARGSVAIVRDAVEARLVESIATRGFLALGLPMSSYDATVRALADRHGAQVVDVTGLLIDAMRAAAERYGVPWDLVLASDAQPTGSPDRANLDALVAGCVPAVVDAIAATVDEGDPARAVLLVDAAPLSRYRHVAVLTRWTDPTNPRHRPVWLAVPQEHNAPGSLLDGRPLPLGSPGQYVRVQPDWRPPTSGESSEPGGPGGRDGAAEDTSATARREPSRHEAARGTA